MDKGQLILNVDHFSQKQEREKMLARYREEELPGFRLTLRDIAIIKAIFEYRALTAPQIAALFFSPDRTGEVNTRCKHRLRMLYHYGYLFRDEQPSKLSEGRKPFVYFLDSRGAEWLSQQLGKVIEWDRKDNRVSWPFLDHLLATNDIRVAINLAALANGMEIVAWLDDKSLKGAQMKDKITLRGERGGKVEAAVVPDSYLRLDAQEDIYNFFLEVDRGTVTGDATQWGKRDWGRKIKAYLEYYKSGLYEKRYHTADMRILTITTSETRLTNLKRITEDAGGKARFWFATFERIKHADILTNPLWTVATHEGLSALIVSD